MTRPGQISSFLYAVRCGLLGVFALACTLPAQAAGGAHTDRLIVKYRAGKGQHSFEDIESRLGVRVKRRRTSGLGAELWQLPQGLSEAEASTLVRQITARDADVLYAEPDRLLQPLRVLNDTRASEQWDLHDPTAGIHVDDAWDHATGSGVVVAVLDTGVRPHADLAANLLPGYDFIADVETANDGSGRDADAQDPGDSMLAGECGGGYPSQDHDSSWHGTHVAGTIAAVGNNASGIAGIAWQAKVLPVRVLGKCGGYTSDIADALVWAAGGAVQGVPANLHPAKVVNLSLGGSGACGSTFQSAISAARHLGTTIVVAAGNSSTDASRSSPANCPGVITVAATGRTGGKAFYSNYGAIVDIAAPGGDKSLGVANGILSTLNNGTRGPGADSFESYQGTSMATPHVAGVVALMLEKNPTLTPDQVEAALKRSARPFPATCNQCGAGLLDANAAVLAATGAQPDSPAQPGTPITQETESNNSLANANLVGGATTIAGSLGSRSDVDVYQVDLPGGSFLAISLYSLSARSNSDLQVLGPDGRLLATSRLGYGRADRISLSPRGTTTSLYLRVVSGGGISGPLAGRYRLEIVF